MARTVSTGRQQFDLMRKNNNFYVDKTKFIEEWWNDDKDVTLVTRPRRFGKTLMMSTVKCFFSSQYKDRKDLFDGLYISQNPELMELQGTIPVIALSFSDCKNAEDYEGRAAEGYKGMIESIKQEISDLYKAFPELLDSRDVSDADKRKYRIICDNDDPKKFTTILLSESIQFLCRMLFQHHGVKPLILLDEYDTPLQEAYTAGYWKKLVATMRSLFNKSFKTTNYFQRALITGITRDSKESLFSDVNNFKAVSVTSDLYADCFSFTEKEVFDALEEYGRVEQKQKVKDWYDGFVFGSRKEIYNPYSIACLLDEHLFKTYWAETSSNALASQLIRNGDASIKEGFLKLMNGETITCAIDENVVFADLDSTPSAVWSLLLASGYIKSLGIVYDDDMDEFVYTLSLTNRETKVMFKKLVRRWFVTKNDGTSYNEFIMALLRYDLEQMNFFLNRVALQSFSYFDTANKSPEAFWQGFVIGLVVALEGKYRIASNRAAGLGIYDVQLKPRDKSMQAFVIEFKSLKIPKRNIRKDDGKLKEGVKEALQQIEDNKYYMELVSEGFPVIRKLGIAFRGQSCLIGDEESVT